MTKQEKLSALQILKKFVESKNFGVGIGCFKGLCLSINYLNNLSHIDREQMRYLHSLIPKKRPFACHCWRKGLKKPRIVFINKKIKQLRKEK